MFLTKKIDSRYSMLTVSAKHSKHVLIGFWYCKWMNEILLYTTFTVSRFFQTKIRKKFFWDKLFMWYNRFSHLSRAYLCNHVSRSVFSLLLLVLCFRFANILKLNQAHRAVNTKKQSSGKWKKNEQTNKPTLCHGV